MAIIDPTVVRIRRDTLYRPIFERFAKRHNRRIVLADSFKLPRRTIPLECNWPLEERYRRQPNQGINQRINFGSFYGSRVVSTRVSLEDYVNRVTIDATPF